MKLKKSDKIIAVIGVIILIISGIGIALYPSEEKKIVKETTMEEHTYKVIVDNITEQVFPDNTNYVVKDKILRDQPYIGTVEIKEDNLKSVCFKFDYTDNIYGMLFKLIKKPGQDKLTITITDKFEHEIGKKTIIGSGNATISDQGITEMIKQRIIKADSIENATDILRENFKTEDKSYNIKVTLDVKETIFRPLAFIREKLLSNGDNFKLTVEYTYYKYSLEKIEEEKEKEKEENYSETTETTTYLPPVEIIKNTSYGSGRIWL